MSSPNRWSIKLSFVFLFFFAVTQTAFSLPSWSYDPGPSPQNKMQKALIDLNAEIPYMPGVSKQLMGKQKFRPAFGPVTWRMLQGKNKVKILFIGQDATHIAEAAGRPATAGFGGRAQDLAKYFGVDESAAFMNTYAFTIKGQYGAYQTPYLFTNTRGESTTRIAGFVSNQLWLMTQDPGSPIAKWRNDIIDHIIRDNADTIKLIVLFGGAARDAAASFVESKGGVVGTRNSKASMKNIEIAETALKYAGGNNEFPVLLDSKGKDLYAKVLGRRLDYSKQADQTAALDAVKDNLEDFIDEMVFTEGGPYKNGLLHPAQLGGYDLRKMTVNGVKTLSLKGLKLSDGTTIKNDILVAQLPHPSALSRLDKKTASQRVASSLKAFAPYVKKGWEIEADPGERNKFAAEEDYVYSRADIGPEYYDFGTPGTRMVPVSTASRMRGNAHVIVFGTRSRVAFDMTKIKEMSDAQPSEKKSADEVWLTRPRTLPARYVYDPGPGKSYAKLMKQNLDLEAIFTPKEGSSFRDDGIEAYNVKSHPDVGDFGHYRGTFKDPRVLILADPSGYDDLISARALTGSRGQYLHGLMKDVGVGDDYLVIKTVPFGMDKASKAEWKVVLEQTADYREKLIRAFLKKNAKKNQPELVLTDGPHAKAELARILGNSDTQSVVHIKRTKDLASGIKKAGKDIVEYEGFEGTASAKMADIPRSHMSFYARIWEGTSGDRVLASDDQYRGLGFAEVAPKWAWQQKVSLSSENQDAVDALIERLEDAGVRLPGESVPKFLKRVGTEALLILKPNTLFAGLFDFKKAS